MAIVFALGSNGSGQLGIGHNEDVSVPKPVLWTDGDLPKSILRVAAGGNHTLLLSGDGTLYWSGNASSGACGLVPSETQTSQSCFNRMVFGYGDPSVESRITVSLVAATWEASIFTVLDDEGKSTKIFSCGFGSHGELGQGELVVRDPRASQLKDFPPEGTEIVDLAACMGHVVAVLNTGEVFGWGMGRKGQLGDPSETIFSPRKIQNVGFHVKRAVCGKEFTCLIGDRGVGRLIVLGSDKWNIKSEAPPAVSGWTDIGASWGNMFILKDDGKVVAWGRSDYSQNVPPQSGKVCKIAVGSEHALALLETGDVMAWGWGEHGNCGPPTKREDNTNERRNTIASAKFLPSSTCISAIGAGCATSWVVIESSGSR